MFGADVLADDFEQVGQWHHGAAHHIVKLLLFLLGTTMAEGDILQADGRSNLCGHAYLLADAVHQVELHFGEEDGEWDTGESAACTEVHDGSARCKLGVLGDAQRVQHVVLVQVGDVLARDDVNLRVPIQVEVVQGRKLAVLLLAQIREVFGYDVHNVFFNFVSNNVRFLHTALRARFRRPSRGRCRIG